MSSNGGGDQQRLASNRSLWQVLARETRDADVRDHLTRAAARLQAGTTYYKPPSSSAAAELSKVKMDPKTLAFLTELSGKLFLDQMQTKDLFQTYFTEVNLDIPTRDIARHLKKVLASVEERAKLTNDLVDFYHEERLHLLRCQKHLLAFYHNRESEWAPFAELYGQSVLAMVVGGLSEQERAEVDAGSRQSPLIKATFKSYKSHLEESLLAHLSSNVRSTTSTATTVAKPALKLYKELKISVASTPTSSSKPETGGQLLTAEQTTKLAIQVLKEKREVLHVLCLYFMTLEPCCADIDLVLKLVEDVVIDAKAWERLCSLQQSDFSLTPLVARIRCLHVVLTLQVMSVNAVQSLLDSGDRSALSALFSSLDKLHAKLCAWVSSEQQLPPHFAPVLLAWGSVRSVEKLSAVASDAMSFLEAAVTTTAQAGHSLLPGESAVPNCVFDFLLMCAQPEKSTVFFAEGLGRMRTSLAVVNTLVSEVLIAVMNLLPFEINPMPAVLGSDPHEIRRHQQMFQRACNLAVTLFGREPLTREFFWAHRSTVVHDLVAMARRRFPDDFLPMCRLYSSLTGDLSGDLNDRDRGFAEHVFSSLSLLEAYTERRPLASGRDVDWQFADAAAFEMVKHADRFEYDSAPEIVSLRPLALCDASQWGQFVLRQHAQQSREHAERATLVMLLPPGTRGKILYIEDGKAVVQWYGIGYSLWHLFSTMLDLALNFSAVTDGTLPQAVLEDHVQLVDMLGQLAAFPDVWAKVEQHTAHMIRQASSTMRVGAAMSDESSPLLLRVFRLLHRCGELSLPPVSLVAACMRFLTRAAQADATLVWQHFVQFGMLTETGGCLRSVLYHSEKREGVYTVTMQLLRCLPLFITAALGQKAPAAHAAGLWDTLPLYLRHVVHDVFADHGSWRYQNLEEQSTIAGLVLAIWRLVLSPAFQVENKGLADLLRRELLQNVLLDPTVCSALLNIVSQGSQRVNSLFAARKSTPAKARIRLIEQAFFVIIESLKQQPQASVACELERRLLNYSDNLLSEIASYAKHTRTPNLPVLATQLLTQVCRFSSKVGSQSVYSSLGPRAQTLLNIFVNRLRERGSTTDLIVAILGFVKEAVASQPGLLKLLLDVKPGSKEGAPPSLGPDSCLHEVLKILGKQSTPRGWLEEEPRMSSATLELILALWHSQTTEVLRAAPGFWQDFLQPLSFVNTIDDEPSLAETKACHRILAQASVMQVLTLEAYYTRGKVDSSLQKAMDSFTSQTGFLKWTFTSKVSSLALADAQRTLLEAWERLIVVCSTQRTASSSAIDDGFSPCYGFQAQPEPRLLLHVAEAVETQLRILSDTQLPEGVDLPQGAEKDLRYAYLANAEILSRLLLILLHRSALFQRSQQLNGDGVALFAKLVESINHIGTFLEATAVIQASLYPAVIWLLQMFWPSAPERGTVRNTEAHEDFRDLAHAILPTLWTYLASAIQSQIPPSAFEPRASVEAAATHRGAAVVETEQVIEASLSLIGCLLERLVPVVGLPPNMEAAALTSSLARTGLLEVVLRLLSSSMSSLKGPQVVSAALQLVSTLAKIQGGAQMLSASRLLPDGGGVVHHLVLATASLWKRSTTGFTDRLPSYETRGVIRRNAWHSAWCQSVCVLSTTLRVLGHDGGHLADVLNFVAARGDPILAALTRLDRVSGHELGLADLEEIAACAVLCAELSRFAQHWTQVMPGITHPGGLVEIMARLLQVCVHYIQRESAHVKAFTKDDHDLEQRLVFVGQVPSTPVRPTGGRTFASALDAAASDEATKDSVSLFALSEAGLLQEVAQACVLLLCNFSLEPRIHFCSQVKATRQLVSPDTLTSMEHMPSLGTLLSCLTACKDLFKLVSKVEASSEVKSNQLRLKQNHVQLTVDKCLLLVVSQSALMLQTEATQGFVNNGDLRNQLRRFLDWLVKWDQDRYGQDAKDGEDFCCSCCCWAIALTVVQAEEGPQCYLPCTVPHSPFLPSMRLLRSLATHVCFVLAVAVRLACRLVQEL
eukprot:m.361278 g.361278  ORF g.361278 m.361278 type:complete len:2004 (-) comp19956_c0_seq24:164-6175(-)